MREASFVMLSSSCLNSCILFLFFILTFLPSCNCIEDSRLSYALTKKSKVDKVLSTLPPSSQSFQTERMPGFAFLSILCLDE